MKASKISFDFSDRPELVATLRLAATRSGKSQKEILTQALEALFANDQENLMLSKAAEKTFKEWDNPEDKIYDDF